MSIKYEILGPSGRDNALLVTVDTGQSLHRLLLGCGEGCLSSVPIAHIQEIEAVFFSHFHIDHIAGFDTLLRMNWCRPEGPVRIFGPPGATEVLHHRLRGFTWNLVDGSPGQWRVSEVDESNLRTSQFLACEGFATEHPVEESPHNDTVYTAGGFQVTVCRINHGTTCLAYVVCEDERLNIDTAALRDLGLQPGPWLRAVKDLDTSADTTFEIDGTAYRVGALHDRLLTTSPGDSIAYLTDFYLDTAEAENRLVTFLNGCRTIVCENNYRGTDAQLARKNFHMTSADVGRLAARVGPDSLIIFHLSDRYAQEEVREQLEEVREHFARAVFPEEWKLS